MKPKSIEELERELGEKERLLQTACQKLDESLGEKHKLQKVIDILVIMNTIYQLVDY